ncbi:unnamed protein product [Scytosiphon promiscuus]
MDGWMMEESKEAAGDSVAEGAGVDCASRATQGDAEGALGKRPEAGLRSGRDRRRSHPPFLVQGGSAAPAAASQSSSIGPPRKRRGPRPACGQDVCGLLKGDERVCNACHKPTLTRWKHLQNNQVEAAELLLEEGGFRSLRAEGSVVPTYKPSSNCVCDRKGCVFGVLAARAVADDQKRCAVCMQRPKKTKWRNAGSWVWLLTAYFRSERASLETFRISPSYLSVDSDVCNRCYMECYNSREEIGAKEKTTVEEYIALLEERSETPSLSKPRENAIIMTILGLRKLRDGRVVSQEDGVVALGRTRVANGLVESTTISQKKHLATEVKEILDGLAETLSNATEVEYEVEDRRRLVRYLVPFPIRPSYVVGLEEGIRKLEKENEELWARISKE